MSDNKKTAVEACREVSKALRANLDSLKKAELSFSPKDAALRVLPEVVNQIKAYEERLVKMRQLETGQLLEKAATPLFTAPPKLKAAAQGLGHISHSAQDKTTGSDFATVASPGKIQKDETAISATTPESNKEETHKFKLSKVFEILGKTSIMEAHKKWKDANSTDGKQEDERGKDAYLPNDKELNEVSAQGSGGKIKKGKKLSKSEAYEILNKALPRMGGQDASSKMMSLHASSAGAKAADSGAAKINNMPAAQLPKMPSPSVHAARASSLSSFMPKGKFDKAELMKEIESMDMTMKKGMEDMQKAFDSKGRFLTPDKLQSKKKKGSVQGKK